MLFSCIDEIHLWDVDSSRVARIRWSENNACQGIMVIEAHSGAAQRCEHFVH